MNKDDYKLLVNKYIPKEKTFKNAIIAFLIGGFLGLISELFVNILNNNFGLSISDSSSYLTLLIILITTFITATGKFDNLVTKGRCGLIIPTTGFAHSVCSSMIDYKKDGYITGIGSNTFKLAGSVILYGIISSIIFVFIKVIFCG